MDNKVLMFAVALLAGCQPENENPKANFDAPASPQTVAYHVRTQQLPQAQPLPVTSRQLARPTSNSTQTGDDQKTVYKCKQPDGKILFTDKRCGNIEQTIQIAESKHLKTPPVPAYSSNPVMHTSAPTQTKSAYQKPSAYEINKRYDNLARKINAIFDRNDKAQLNQALLMLERDRNHALSMQAEIKQSHDINKRYDNMARETSFRNESKALAYQLLKIERMRNQALYRDNVSF
ncbi:MAG: hypothetical protein KJ914_15055 [Gammaproteobacteria bacterium]|nr:hypothetical protein [Gammaproteobacteria bacterium]MBU1723626.1 hypothetical protein [Gammaproteobacteria bacterium]MBU2006646.1 hypothetical protein [Gammaproteobacteria bacterium]